MMPPPSTPPHVTGLRLGGILGCGATSTVWAASREQDGAPVAVKVIAPERYHVGALMELAARECAILDLVQHDHIVRMHEVHPLADGSVAVVLDLADGGTLADLLAARGRLTAGETATICTPVASALAALHQAGVIHGDVSPHNVLFTREGRPMLADFEAARLVGESHPPVVAGTAGFLAPEVLAGGLPTQASDVYAVGALAWFALTGRAFGATGKGGVPTGPVRGPAHTEARGLVGDEFADVVVELLADDPQSRPSADEAAIRCYEAAVPAPVRLMPLTAPPDPAVALTQRLRNPGATDPRERAAMPAPDPILPAGSASGYAAARPARTLPPSGPLPDLPAPPAPPVPTAPQVPTHPPASALLGPAATAAGGRPPAPAASPPPGAPGRAAPPGPAATLEPAGAEAGPVLAGRGRRQPARHRQPSGGGGSRPSRSPARPWVRVVVLVSLAAVVTAGLVALLVSRRGAPASATTVASTSPTTGGPGQAGNGLDPLRADPKTVVGQLARARAEALMSGDPAQLTKADAPDSALHKADVAILESLRRSGQRYTGLSFTVRSADWVSGDGSTARVLAIVDRSAYDVAGPGGERRQVPAEPGRPLVYSLVRAAEGWRISDVQA